MFVVATVLLMVSPQITVPTSEPIPFEEKIPLPPKQFVILPDKLYVEKKKKTKNKYNPNGEKYVHSKSRWNYKRNRGHIS